MAGSGLFLNSWTIRTSLLLRVFFALAGGGLSASFGKVRGADFLRTSLWYPTHIVFELWGYASGGT